MWRSDDTFRGLVALSKGFKRVQEVQKGSGRFRKFSGEPAEPPEPPEPF
jgi:hypothetical protein